MHPTASIVQGPDTTFHICSAGATVEVGGLVGGKVPANSPVYSNRFGEPSFGSLTTSAVAAARIRSATWLGVRFGSCCRMSAAAPATWGHAIDVPLMVALPVSDDDAADVIEDPGAKMSRHDP